MPVLITDCRLQPPEDIVCLHDAGAGPPHQIWPNISRSPKIIRGLLIYLILSFFSKFGRIRKSQEQKTGKLASQPSSMEIKFNQLKWIEKGNHGGNNEIGVKNRFL